jgi:hypothetical protein
MAWTSQIESESERLGCQPFSFEHALAQASTSSGIRLSKAYLFRSSMLMRLDHDLVLVVGRRPCLRQPLAMHRPGEGT